jgi:hypothetical protein
VKVKAEAQPTCTDDNEDTKDYSFEGDTTSLDTSNVTTSLVEVTIRKRLREGDERSHQRRSSLKISLNIIFSQFLCLICFNMLRYFQNLDCTYKLLLSIEMKMQKVNKKKRVILMFGGTSGVRGWIGTRLNTIQNEDIPNTQSGVRVWVPI